MTRAVTIVDIARALDLSKSTVSSALTGQGRSSEATRRRVVEAAARMGYVTNRAARQLRVQSTGAWGLYIPAQVRMQSFYMQFTFGVVDEAAALGYDVTLFGRTSEPTQKMGPQIDGAIVADPLPDDPVIERLARTGVPLVTGGPMRGSNSRLADGVIEVDNYKMGRQVLDQLVRLGARLPALMAPDAMFDSPWAGDVRDTYLAWCEDHRIEPKLATIAVSPTSQDLDSAVRRLITDSSIDALVCAPQGLAGRSQPILESLGYKIGKEFHLAALVGDPATELMNEKITALDLTPFEFGREAARMMEEILQSGATIRLHKFHEAHLRPAVAAADTSGTTM
ncbi:LacI family DNA-binding transcriptional regulator [Specibacter sp. RAF43]|uniref:LacI family DNA-binding transcriptional regulator n=1 Tax=Specibacter sp. RAF43 TaxID=3233057 RepID=UPI003F94D5A1